MCTDVQLLAARLRWWLRDVAKARPPVITERCCENPTASDYCWGGRPPTASLGQNEVVGDSFPQTKGAVREQDYPHWHRHVQEYFCAAWSGCSRAAGSTPQATAQPDA